MELITVTCRLRTESSPHTRIHTTAHNKHTHGSCMSEANKSRQSERQTQDRSAWRSQWKTYIQCYKYSTGNRHTTFYLFIELYGICIGAINFQDVAFLFVVGFWYLISKDPVIFICATSFKLVCRSSSLSMLFMIVLSEWYSLMCSPKRVPCRLFLTSPKCSINLVLMRLRVSPM